MKVIHISTHDRKGGAAIGAFRLHEAMRKQGIDSKMIVKYRSINDDRNIIKIEPASGCLRNRVDSLLKNLRYERPNEKFGQYSDLAGNFKPSCLKEAQEADIIYLHWINSDYIDADEIEQVLQMKKPVYWVLHDMFPITGGCHYAMQCNQYQKSCQFCPFFEKNRKRAYEQLNQKIELANYHNLRFIATTFWMRECARKSSVAQKVPVYQIPYCLETKKFKPLDKVLARELFGIQADKKVIMFGAQAALYNYYKGFSFFQSALELLAKEVDDKRNIIILIFGSCYNQVLDEAIPFETKFLGHLYDEFSLIMAYNCADVFVIPSLAEAFGQTIIESMACNTPVVGFDIGGIPDNVNEKTGYLAKYCDSVDLKQGIYNMLYGQRPDGMMNHVHKKNREELIVKKHWELWKKDTMEKR